MIRPKGERLQSPKKHKGKLLIVFLVISLIAVYVIPLSAREDVFSTSTQSVFSEDPVYMYPENKSAITQNVLNESNVVMPTMESVVSITSNQIPGISSTTKYEETLLFSNYINNQDTPTLSDTSNEIQSLINALGPGGGEIIFESDAFFSETDLTITSNIILSGVNPRITLHLENKCLKIAKNAANITIKDLLIDASDLGEQNALLVNDGAKNISIQNIGILNNPSNKSSILILGNYVYIEKVSFKNVFNGYPIQVAGSHVYITNCNSKDLTPRALVTIAGGITDVHIERNILVNRPLVNAGYTMVSSSNIWILNNEVDHFPAQTYGILVMGGTNEPRAVPFENVTIKGNFLLAGVKAFNGIAIYGLSKNVLVENNTLEMYLSGHNGIGIASGVNVTVNENIVYGSVENSEGGIEIESNPIHNRLIGISENVTITRNIVSNSYWGVYVRIMLPDHVNWAGNPLKSKNILIEGNVINDCLVGVNLLHGENIIVRDNYLNNTQPIKIDQTNVLNYTIIGNMDYSNIP